MPAAEAPAGNGRAGKAPTEAETPEATPASSGKEGWRRAGAGVLGKGGRAGVMLGQVQNILEEDKVLLDSDEPYPSPSPSPELEPPPQLQLQPQPQPQPQPQA